MKKVKYGLTIVMCDFDLHAKCALNEETKAISEMAVKEAGSELNDGWVCDGNVCTKA